MHSPSIRVREESSKHDCFYETLLPITRIFGVFTAVVLCGVGVDITVHQRPSGIYLLVSSLLVFWLEIVWAVTLFLQLCIRPDCRTLWTIWDCVTWIDGWKKTIVYGALAALPLAWPSCLWLSYVAAGQLIALAILYLILSFRGKRRRRRINLLLGHGEGDSFSSSARFEEVTQVLDDGLPEPIPGSSHSLSDSLAEQEPILEI